MEKLNLPPHYQTVMPYLILNGAARFLEFTKKVFGAEEIQNHAAEDGRGIMHAEIKIGDSLVMFADGNEQWGTQTAGLYVHVTNVDETYKKALEAGAKTVMEPVKKDYAYTAGILDPTGNTWWLAQA